MIMPNIRSEINLNKPTYYRYNLKNGFYTTREISDRDTAYYGIKVYNKYPVVFKSYFTGLLNTNCLFLLECKYRRIFNLYA